MTEEALNTDTQVVKIVDSPLDTQGQGLTPTTEEIVPPNTVKADTPPAKLPIETAVADGLFTEESIRDFTRVFPGVNPEEIKKSETFQIFSSLIDAKIPLTDVYTRFKSLCGAIEKRALEKSSQFLANKLSGVGSLSFGESTKDGFFTREQVLKMTPKQISENYDKIRKSQERW
ncbi:MAG: hypothetical protein J6B34_04180 [Clostridia bacterium]|nr:hypothetical protein [Clostridia bacterium]